VARILVRRKRRLLVSTLACAAALAAAPSVLACTASGYTYAGLASSAKTHGVGALVTAIGAPAVSGDNGHVAGWVGVGGPGEGPNGKDEWIQVGFSGFKGSPNSDLYYEVTRAGSAPTYHRVQANLPPGTTKRLAVLEMGTRPNFWRVWVDGRAVSRPIYLPGSHGAWQGVATAESWSETAGGACNAFGYRFQDVVVATRAGGAWQALSHPLPIRNGVNRLLLSGGSSFDAVSGRLDKLVVPLPKTGKPAPGTSLVAGPRATASARR